MYVAFNNTANFTLLLCMNTSHEWVYVWYSVFVDFKKQIIVLAETLEDYVCNVQSITSSVLITITCSAL